MHILFHRRSPWQGVVHCSTNIFAELAVADGMDVTYMSGIMHPGRILKRSGNYDSWKSGFRREAGANVFTPLSLVPFAKHKLLMKSAVADLGYTCCVPPIPKILSRHDIAQPDIVWTVPPGSSALKKVFTKATLVHQVVDYYPAYFGSGIKKIEKCDYDRADIIFTIGHALASYLIDELGVPQHKITALGQGVDTARFEGEPPEPRLLSGLPKPRAVWVGVLDKLDKEYLGEVARKMHALGGCTYLIGPDAHWRGDFIRSHPGLFYFGPIPATDIPAYLLHADIGLMLYDRSRKEVYRGQHPLKLYEYAAAGLGILSTDHDEYAFVRPPAEVISHLDEIDQAIDKLLAQNPETRSGARAFAEKHSWSSVFNKVKEVIAREN